MTSETDRGIDPEQSNGGIGPGGAEIDIMEYFGEQGLLCSIWCNGADELYHVQYNGYNNESFRLFGLCNDDYATTFHTYALLWDEDMYYYYFDNILIAATDFAYGTSTIEEEVILSLCEGASKEVMDAARDRDSVAEAQFDWMRIWQKTE